MQPYSSPIVSDRKSPPSQPRLGPSSSLASSSSSSSSSLSLSKNHEKLLIDFAKRRDNRKCFDCGKLGTQFVNLTIGTFVCLECSGLLRDFDFRVKGLSTSTFSAEEVASVTAQRGNELQAKIWFGKMPNPPVVPPTWDDPEQFRRFMTAKYRNRAFYDASAAAALRSSSSDSSSTTAPLSLVIPTSSNNTNNVPMLSSPSSPSPGRKRAGSGVGGASSTAGGGLERGSAALESKNLFLKSTLNRASSSSHSAPGGAGGGGVFNATPGNLPGNDGDEDEDDDEDEAEEEDANDPSLTLQQREARRKERLRKKIREFYTLHNPEKLEQVDGFTEWVMYHGMAAFNKKLRERYGTDIAMNTKPTLKSKLDKAKRKEREAMRKARMESGGGSTRRPVSDSIFGDEFTSTPPAAATATGAYSPSNPFDEPSPPSPYINLNLSPSFVPSLDSLSHPAPPSYSATGGSGAVDALSAKMGSLSATTTTNLNYASHIDDDPYLAPLSSSSSAAPSNKSFLSSKPPSSSSSSLAAENPFEY